MATPTKEPTFSPRTPIAAAAPVGRAVSSPTISEWKLHLFGEFQNHPIRKCEQLNLGK